MSASGRLPGVPPSPRPRHPVPFPKGARSHRENPERRTPALRADALPLARRKGAGRTERSGAPHGPRMRCTQQAPGVESSGRIRRPRRECACAVARLSSSASPPPGPPAGAPGPAGPCSAAPAPVGSVSSGRRHPGRPLRAPSAHLAEEAGGSGGPRGCRRFGGRSSVPAPAPCWFLAPWEASPSLRLGEASGDLAPPPAGPPACAPQVRCSGAPGLPAAGRPAGVRGAPGPGPALRGAGGCQAGRRRCWEPPPCLPRHLCAIHGGSSGTVGVAPRCRCQPPAQEPACPGALAVSPPRPR